MRVDYTLPSLQPGPLLEADQGTQAMGPSFRDQLRGAPVYLPVNWERQLHLDKPPLSATLIGPPPRPHTLQMNDAETARTRWRNMLFRHTSTDPSAHTPVTSRGQHAVTKMLDMLLRMQRMEDVIVSRNAALTRG